MSIFLFLVLFWILEMLITVNKPNLVPSLSWITTSELIFAEICLDVSKEWVRSWSHYFLIINRKTLSIKILAVRQEIETRRTKRKKNWNGTCKPPCVKNKRHKRYMIPIVMIIKKRMKKTKTISNYILVEIRILPMWVHDRKTFIST